MLLSCIFSEKNKLLFISNSNKKMKKLIFETIIYIFIPVILLLGVGEYALRKIPNDYSYKNNWMIKNSADTKILILGSSHTYYGINPKYFEVKAFNCAYISQPLEFDFDIFEIFINKMDSLKFVVLPISYFSTKRRLKDDAETWREKKYHIYYNIILKNADIENTFEIFDKNPERWNRVKNSLLFKQNDITCDKLGHGISYSSNRKSKDWESTGIAAAKRHTTNTDQAIIKENEDYVDAIVRKCKSRDIKVILLTTPTWHTYSENLNKNQLRMTTDFCKQMSSKYSNIVYIDLLVDKRFESKDFYDADHLCDIGAKKLTLILNDTIMKSNQP